MRKLLVVLLLVGCASKDPSSVGQVPPIPPMYTGRVPEPNAVLETDPLVRPMSRNEVLTAIQECEAGGTRAVMVYGKRKINNYTSDIVVDVNCAPRFGLWK